MDLNEFQGFFKKYSPLVISLIGIMFLLVIGDYRRAGFLLVAGLGMQYFWIRLRYR